VSSLKGMGTEVCPDPSSACVPPGAEAEKHAEPPGASVKLNPSWAVELTFMMKLISPGVELLKVSKLSMLYGATEAKGASAWTLPV
jgi:hypothetical protein